MAQPKAKSPEFTTKTAAAIMGTREALSKLDRQLGGARAQLAAVTTGLDAIEQMIGSGHAETATPAPSQR